MAQGQADGKRGNDALAPVRLDRAARVWLLRLARDTVRAVASGRRPVTPKPDETPGDARAHADCFVTLYKAGELRGCIGTRSGSEAVWQAVMQSAEASASDDPRFSPVRSDEVNDLEIQISVLTPPRSLTWASEADLRDQIEPMVHGVIMRNGRLRALYLPKVWDHFRDADDVVAAFLTHLSRKAGDCSGVLWRDRATEYRIFEALDFGEADPEMAESGEGRHR
jgi:AmmeMemoRadiSam system protein A